MTAPPEKILTAEHSKITSERTWLHWAWSIRNEKDTTQSENTTLASAIREMDALPSTSYQNEHVVPKRTRQDAPERKVAPPAAHEVATTIILGPPKPNATDLPQHHTTCFVHTLVPDKHSVQHIAGTGVLASVRRTTDPNQLCEANTVERIRKTPRKSQIATTCERKLAKGAHL